MSELDDFFAKKDKKKSKIKQFSINNVLKNLEETEKKIQEKENEEMKRKSDKNSELNRTSTLFENSEEDNEWKINVDDTEGELSKLSINQSEPEELKNPVDSECDLPKILNLPSNWKVDTDADEQGDTSVPPVSQPAESRPYLAPFKRENKINITSHQDFPSLDAECSLSPDNLIKAQNSDGLFRPSVLVNHYKNLQNKS